MDTKTQSLIQFWDLIFFQSNEKKCIESFQNHHQGYPVFTEVHLNLINGQALLLVSWSFYSLGYKFSCLMQVIQLWANLLSYLLINVFSWMRPNFNLVASMAAFCFLYCIPAQIWSLCLLRLIFIITERILHAPVFHYWIRGLNQIRLELDQTAHYQLLFSF